jgi:CheY-like chemotaxis protein
MTRWLARLTNKEVLAFDNGAAAIEALALHSPCLVLSDLEMPGPSGEDVAEAARRQPRPPHVVLMSGNHHRLQRARALAQATLEKPFSFKDFQAAVQAASCLKGHELPAPPSTH